DAAVAVDGARLGHPVLGGNPPAVAFLKPTRGLPGGGLGERLARPPGILPPLPRERPPPSPAWSPPGAPAGRAAQGWGALPPVNLERSLQTLGVHPVLERLHRDVAAAVVPQVDDEHPFASGRFGPAAQLGLETLTVLLGEGGKSQVRDAGFRDAERGAVFLRAGKLQHRGQSLSSGVSLGKG